MSQKMFFGGVPVDPEVKLLRSHFGLPVHGQVIAHEDCEAVLGLDRKSSRYKTVIHAWRSSLKRSDNIEFIALPGEGFRVLFDDERVEVHISGVSRGIRKIDRSARALASVPRDALSDPVRAQADNAQVVLAKMSTFMHESQSALAPPAPSPAAVSPRMALVGS
jgi:hypothetical protein